MNLLKRLILKLTNRSRLTQLDLQAQDERFIEKAAALASLADVPANLDVPTVSFKHSGHAGDIIYSLPTVYALSREKPVSFFMHLNRPANLKAVRKSHPLGNVMLNEKMFEMLQPLFLSQESIAACEPYRNETVHYNLDRFRELPIRFNRGHIARWYFLLYAVNADLCRPWIHIEPDRSFADYIMVARSAGNHAPGIDYSFLKQYRKTVFVGVEDEYDAMRCMVPGIEYHPVKDFLELARAIKGAKFFIGNSSFPYSLAEAMKVRRLFEMSYHCPTVMPDGIDGYEFCFQVQFETLVERLQYKDCGQTA